MEKCVGNIIGQPTTKITNILEHQLAQAVGAVSTYQWGGMSCCIALVLNEEPFREAIGSTSITVDRQFKPPVIHPSIDKYSRAYGRLVNQEAQKELIWDWVTQESMDHLIVQRVVASVDPQYLKARNKDYMGLAGEMTKTLIAYIRTAWCRASTHHKKEVRAVFREP